MEQLTIFQSVEFYVIATLVAALIAGVALRPAARGEAVTRLLGATLSHVECDGEAMVEAIVGDDGSVDIIRRGLPPLSDTGAVSAKVTVTGRDIKVEERIVRGRGEGMPVDTAEFTLDFLAPDRYHLQYVSEPTGMSAAMPLNVLPGYRCRRELAC